MSDTITEVTYESEQYRLRAGSPMPVRGSSGGTSDFVLHTFMAEKNKVLTIACTEKLPASSEFRGQGGDLISANFSRLSSTTGGVFTGRKVYNTVFVDEDEIATN